jgi:starch synthase
MVTPELASVKKSGGLADAAQGLSEGLTERGHQVIAVMPKYINTLEAFLRNKFRMKYYCDLGVPIGDKTTEAQAIKATFTNPDTRSKMNVFFLDTRDGTAFGSRTRLYGYHDDVYRFFFFNRAAFELYRHIIAAPGGRSGRPADIVHSHDWQGAFTPFFFKHKSSPPTVHTIHNLGYGPDHKMDLADFSWHINLPIQRDPWLFSWQGAEFHGRVDPSKMGILFADKIVTVSPEHGRELLAGNTPPPGNLYDGILQTRKRDMRGILNGLPDYYNPGHFFETGALPAAFSAQDLEGKRVCRRLLQDRVGLPVDNEAMIVVWSSRLAEQKGIDIAMPAVTSLLERDFNLQFVFVADGEKQWEDSLHQLSRDFPDRFRYFNFAEALEILALGGGDVLLTASRYEPGGLNHRKAQKLGCPPLAHATGGFIDTVEDGKTGFLFKPLMATNLLRKLLAVQRTYQQDRSFWNNMIRNCLELDYSWSKYVDEYIDLYYEALGR